MPALFVGHGNPMNAIEDNAYSRVWRAMGETLPTPRAILCVSAHWMTRGSDARAYRRAAEDDPRFRRLPARTLRAAISRARRAGRRARRRSNSCARSHLETDTEWGLDHGAWSVLIQMFPEGEHSGVPALARSQQEPAGASRTGARTEAAAREGRAGDRQRQSRAQSDGAGARRARLRLGAGVRRR